MDLTEIAATQHHAFTSTQAKSCGHTWRTVAALVASDDWLELVRGVYVEAAIWAALDRDGKHLCRLHAALLAKQKADWSAARRSAAAVHDVPFLGYAPDRPQLLRDRGATLSRSHNRHERVGELAADDRVEVDGLSVTSLAKVWEDMSSEEPFRSSVVLADGILRRGVARETLVARASNDVARQAAFFADPLAESALESISRVGCLTQGLPIPRLQIKVLYGGEEIARVDGLWEDYGVIGQADGALKYKDSDRVMKDKWQDERLESLGFIVSRWGWNDAWHPALMANGIRRAFRRAEGRSIDPGVRLVQATLAESLSRWRWVA